MALSAKLRLQQRQALVMTPQMQQSIQLLQMSSADLINYVERELEQNPLLNRSEEADTTHGSGRERSVSEDGYHAEMKGSYTKKDFPLGDGIVPYWRGRGLGKTNPLPQGTKTSPDASSAARSGEAGHDGPDLVQSIAAEPSLRDHLLAQVGTEIADPTLRVVARNLVDMVDADGYMRGDTAGLATTLGVKEDLVLDALTVVQSFDPPGVGARDLKECLGLQLKERGALTRPMASLLGHLDLLAENDLSGLARLCGISEEEMADLAEALRRLNPKPGLQFDTAAVQTVIPDVILKTDARGRWTVELNEETLPDILLDRDYKTAVRKSARSEKDKAYLDNCYQTAHWLVKALHQRAVTMLRVATEIARCQESFFVKGVMHLKPLTLNDVAEAVELHESTISRVIANKYMATPRGVFPLKYFFSTALGKTDDEAGHSAKAVRHLIREMITEEAAGKVLSDSAIADALAVKGIRIARRTVAKYREEMQIPPSSERRKKKSRSGSEPARP